jgi:hypothetical protein
MSKLLIACGILLVLSMGCMGGGSEEVATTAPAVTEAPATTSPPTTSPPETAAPEIIVPEWMDAELTDPVTLETFKISDFKGKPMLLLNFNTLLTQSLKQQQAMKELKDSQGDSIVLISLNLDQSEDKRSIGGYVNKHGFDWYFVLPPPGMKDDLVDDFGLDIINPEKVPVVLICKDLSSRILDQGVKSADTLLGEIDSGC